MSSEDAPSGAAHDAGVTAGAGAGAGAAGAGAGAGAGSSGNRDTRSGSGSGAAGAGAAASTAEQAARRQLLLVGDNVDDFDCETQLGPLNFYKFISGKFCLLFSHPADFTPVCTTELLTLVSMQPEFAERNAVILGLSVDPAKTHVEWVRSIEDADTKVNFPIIGDLDGSIARKFNMIHPKAASTEHGRLTVRTVVLIDPEKRVQLLMHYPAGTGRNFHEILRCIDSLTVTLEHKVGTPANWAKGEDVVILPSVNEDEAKAMFPKGFVAIKPYLRITPDPTV